MLLGTLWAFFLLDHFDDYTIWLDWIGVSRNEERQVLPRFCSGIRLRLQSCAGATRSGAIAELRMCLRSQCWKRMGLLDRSVKESLIQAGLYPVEAVCLSCYEDV